MAEDQDQYSFSSEDLQKIIQQTVQSLLSPRTYDQSQVPAWINEVCQAIMQKLITAQKPFKYLVNCMIMQRKGANVVTSNSMYWDTSLDSCFTFTWPRERAGKAQQSKNTIQCLVSVYAMTTLNGNTFLKNQM